MSENQSIPSNRIRTKAVRHLYHRWTEAEPYGYRFDSGAPDIIGHAVLDTVNGLCDALDEALVLLKGERQPGDGQDCLCTFCKFIGAHGGWT